MKTRDFYHIIDNELDHLLDKYKDDEFLKKQKETSNQKSYALLIWFLEFYGKISNYTNFITDGNNDSSCDIIFDNKDNQGNKIFYIVQSKWNISGNCEKETNKDEILKALSDFETILRGEKKNVNAKLAKKLEELDKHLKANGEVKFIFLSLCQYKNGAAENIKAFQNNDEKIKFEVIDINRIKVDYIDRKYKNIEPLNPLENYQDPEESPIIIEIERLKQNGRISNENFIRIEKPFEAYVFLLRPKSIYELFEKYGFALFFKNVRNPLLQSQFNKEIETTASENPAFFWYYNNGITGITYLLPTIGKQALKINLTGLQIINGAQTVYSIYRSYKNASPTKRKQMDSEALVTLRLLKSGGKDFDLNVTRFTNSQNPVNDRDFYANDDIQVELQNASYNTNIWYEKRRSEFRELPREVRKITNQIFANLYLAYQLQDPVSVLKNHARYTKTSKDLNFVSHKDDKDGLYEKIFNDRTKFEDMLCAFYVFETIVNKKLPIQITFNSNLYHLIALFRVAFTKYLQAKYDDKINVNKFIIGIYEKGETDIIRKTFRFLNNFVEKEVEVKNDQKKTTLRTIKFLLELAHYEKIKEQLEELEIKPEDIENIILNEDEEIIEVDANEDESFIEIEGEIS
jgi:hypothetical protein